MVGARLQSMQPRLVVYTPTLTNLDLVDPDHLIIFLYNKFIIFGKSKADETRAETITENPVTEALEPHCFQKTMY